MRNKRKRANGGDGVPATTCDGLYLSGTTRPAFIRQRSKERQRQKMSLGSFKNVDGGVSWSRGRGAAKVSIFLDFKTLEDWARKTAQDEAKLWERAYAAACKGLRIKFQKVIRSGGGVEGVPKFKDFDAFTKSLMEKRGRDYPLGGLLTLKRNIGAWKSNGYQYIGWKDYIKDYAVKFQDGGTPDDDRKLTEPGFRQTFHRMGVHDIPTTYAHNERAVLPEPFGSYVDRYLDEWARGAYYKQLARIMAKDAQGMT